MDKNRKIAMILAIILATGMSIVIGLSFTQFKTIKTIVTNHPTEDDYKKFEEYSLTVAKDLNTEEILDEDALITYENTSDSLIVNVVSKNYGYGVKSAYPILNSTINSENVIIKSDIDLNNVKHEHYANFKAQMENKTYSIFLYSFVILCIYIILFGICYIVILRIIQYKK